MRRGILFVAALAMTALLPACSHNGTTGSEEAPAPAPILAVTAAKVVVAPMKSELKLLGTTKALNHVVLRAPAAGRVTHFTLQDGDVVRRGQKVATIISREQEAAAAGLEVARKLDPADAAGLERSVKTYVARPGIALRAPQNGIVSQVLVGDDQIVANLDPLADLVDPKSIYVDAAVPIDDLGLIKPGMPADVTSPISPGVVFPARVAAMSPTFATGGATASARVEFTTNRRITVAGAAVEAAVTTRSVPHAIVIPAAALFEDAANDQRYVFVAGKDGKAHRTVIQLGIRQAREVQVTSGLKPGELVITSGGYALSDGLAVRPTVVQN